MEEKVRKLLSGSSNQKIFKLVVDLCNLTDPDMGDLVLSKKDAFQDMILELYLEHYTEEEIDFMLSKVESPIGMAIIAKEDILIEKSMAVSEKFIETVASELQVFKAMKKFNNSNPPN